MKVVLDTSFLLELRRKNKEAANLLKKESEDASDIGISILTLYELEVGSRYIWLKRKDLSERFWLDDIMKWLTVYRLTEEGVRRAAEIRAKSMLKGEVLPDMDLLIATTANGPVKLLTSDEDHLRMSSLLEEIDVKVIYIKPRSK